MTATGSNSLITNSNSGIVPAPWAGVILKGVKTAAPGTQMPDVYGYVSSSKNGLAKGLYRLPRNANDSFSLLCDGFKSDYKACLVGDIYYSARQLKLPIPPPFAPQSIIFYEGHDIYSGDLLTNAKQIGEAEKNKVEPCGMSYNPVDGKIYALLGGYVSASRLVTIEIPSKLDDVKITTIAEYNPAGKLNSFAIDNEGKGYAIDNNGYLNSIDLSNGQIKQIGFTEIMPATYRSGMTFDRKTGRLFWSVTDELKSALYEVNPTTAETTLISVYPGNEFVTGIFTLDPINDKVPGPDTAVTTGGFEKASKTGSFSFTAPTTLADGTVASGNVKYRVYVNDKEMFSGTTSYGQQTTISPVTVGDRGKICFSVVFSNDVGDSRKAQCHTDIGNSIPLAVSPQTISTRKTNDGVRIKWRGIRFGTDDCYFDPTQVKYDVYRYCAGDGIRTLVASEISDTTITDVFSAPENATIYQYQIYSKFATETSEVTYSSHIVLGHKELPFACDFSTPYTLLDWNIVNMNNDLISTHYTWSWDKIGNIPSASLYGVKGYPEDDWLITSLFKMKAGKAYRVRMQAGAVIKANNGTVAMYYGNSINPESMDTIDGELLPPTKVKDITAPYGDEGNILRFESYIVPERDCDIAIGIHGKGVGSVDILSFDISEGVDARRPGVVTDLTATGEVKHLKAQIKFNAPKFSLMNTPLEKLTKIEILRDDTIALGTIDNPAPGAPVTVNIDKAAPGAHRYSIVPYNEYGEGAASVVTVKVGFDAPNPPVEAKQVETTTLGTTTLTWNPVTMTASKQELTGEDVAYNVATIEGNAVGKILHKNLRDTTARVFWQAPNAEQSFAQFCVQAVTNGGGSAWQASEIIPVGKPYTDYYHCFAGRGLDGFGIGFMNIVDWRTQVSIRSDILEPYIKSATGDGGYLGIMMMSVGAVTEVFSGKISLKNIAQRCSASGNGILCLQCSGR